MRAAGLLSYFTRHRTAANLLLVLLIASGLYAFPNMRAQYFPDVVVDEVDVVVQWDGAGAEDVDGVLVEILEPALQAVEGATATSSRSREGSARIEVEFEPGWDMARAEDDVESALEAVTGLPDTAEDPTIRRAGWWDQVTDVVISGPVSPDVLGRLADEFVTRLYSEGVTGVSIRGVVAPRIVLEVTTASLIRNDITLSEIAQAVRAEVEANPAGDVEGANARVRTGVEKRSPDQIVGIVLRSDPGGGQLTIGDVARIEVEGIDRERSYFRGQEPAISIRVDRSAAGDAIATQESVERVAAEVSATMPQGVSVDLIRTRAEAIEGRLNILIENGLTGLALVVGLLFLFLNARTAFWVAAGIPVAMFAAIAMMWVAGLTLNMISMFALLIVLGIVVDDAIVVGEHADFRVRRLGEDPRTAAENAATRMAMPVFSATITTVIAFSGLMLIEGRFGDMIADIPFTVIVVLIASLIECFLVLPNHMAHSLAAAQRKRAWYDWPSHVVNIGFDWFRVTLFRPFMGWVIWARYPVIAALFVLLASQVTLFIRGEVPWRFFASPEEGSVMANFAMTPGATREDTFAQMVSLQEDIDRLAQRYEDEYGRNPLDYVLAQIGGNTRRVIAGADTKDTDLLGGIAVELIDPDLRPYTSSQFVRDLQDEARRHPLVETLSFRGWRGGFGGDNLDVQIFGSSPQGLKTAAEALKTRLAQYGEISGLEDSMSYDKAELVLDLTPQGAALGFTIDALGRELRDRLNGIEAATFPDGPRSAEIRVRLPEEELQADFLDRMLMRTETGDYVPLADLVRVTREEGFSTIRRENGIRVISVTGEISEDDPARAQQITEELSEVILPDIRERFGVETRLAGQAEEERGFLADAALGFMACLVGIYATLAWVFSSWTRPLLIMAVIPFGLIGAIYGHVQWDLPLSMFTVVGLIGMSGIIINDSIVLVTTVDEYSKERGLVPAIMDASADRLRPVILTTLTTVIGLIPLLFEPSRQAQFLKPTVVTLVYGLGFGMVLVLLIVPALLAAQQDIHRQFQALRRALGDPRRAGFAGAVSVVAAFGVAGLFAATLGATLWSGALWAPLQALPALSAMAGPWPALGLFLAGALVWLLVVYAVAGLLALVSGRKPALPPAE